MELFGKGSKFCGIDIFGGKVDVPSAADLRVIGQTVDPGPFGEKTVDRRIGAVAGSRNQMAGRCSIDLWARPIGFGHGFERGLQRIGHLDDLDAHGQRKRP